MADKRRGNMRFLGPSRVLITIALIAVASRNGHSDRKYGDHLLTDMDTVVKLSSHLSV